MGDRKMTDNEKEMLRWAKNLCAGRDSAFGLSNNVWHHADEARKAVEKDVLDGVTDGLNCRDVFAYMSLFCDAHRECRAVPDLVWCDFAQAVSFREEIEKIRSIGEDD